MLWYIVPSNAYLKHQVSSVIHAVQPHCTSRLLSHKDNWLLQSLCPTFKWLQQSFRLSFSPGLTGRSGPHVSLSPPKKSSPLQDSLPAPTVLAWSQYYAESTISSAPQSIALPGAKYCKALQSIALPGDAITNFPPAMSVLPHLQGNLEIGRHKDRNAEVGNTKHRIYWH